MTDEKIEQNVSTVLRSGVLISGVTVLVGGIYFLIRHGREKIDFATFKGQPEIDRIVHEIVLGAFHLRARSIVQFGILLLIATPILRVGISLVDFAFEKDRDYVIVTSIVLAVLLFSLISGAVTG